MAYVNKKKFFITLFSIFCIYSIFWWCGQLYLQEKIQSYIEEATPSLKINIEDIDIKGFPLQYIVEIENISIEKNDDWLYTSPFLKVHYSPFSYKDMTVIYSGTHYIKRKNDILGYRVNCNYCLMNISFSDRFIFKNMSHALEDIDINLGDVKKLSLSKGQINTQFSTEESTDKLSFSSHIEHMTSNLTTKAGFVSNLSAKILKANLEGSVTGMLQGQSIQEVTKNWIDQLGSLYIEKLDLQTPDTSLTLIADTAVDKDRFLNGQIIIKGLDIEKFTHLLAAENNISKNLRKGASIFANFISNGLNTKLFSKNDIALQLKKGGVYFGPFSLFKIQPLPYI